MIRVQLAMENSIKYETKKSINVKSFSTKYFTKTIVFQVLFLHIWIINTHCRCPNRFQELQNWWLVLKDWNRGTLSYRLNHKNLNYCLQHPITKSKVQVCDRCPLKLVDTSRMIRWKETAELWNPDFECKIINSKTLKNCFRSSVQHM